MYVELSDEIVLFQYIHLTFDRQHACVTSVTFLKIELEQRQTNGYLNIHTYDIFFVMMIVISNI